MAPWLLLASAVVPALALLWYFYSRDANPEPRGVVLRTFFLGMVICAPVVPVAIELQKLGGTGGGPLGHALREAFLGAAVPEELFKFAVLWLWVRRQPVHGLVYGATASLGFAALENALYVASGGVGTALMRAVTAVPSHALTGAIMGAFAGRAVFGPGRSPASPALGVALVGLLAAIALHGAYDFVLMLDSGVWGLLALPILWLEIHWARRWIARLRAEQAALAAVVPAQPLT